MTSYIHWLPSNKAFENLGEKRGRRFHSVQKGAGPSIQLVSPTQQTVERAKMDLKHQMEESGQVGPGINSAVTRKRKQSAPGRRRVKKKKITKPKKTKPKKTQRKNAKTTKICKITKRRKFARKK